MINSMEITINVLSYKIIEGNSKKTGKPFRCIKIDGYCDAVPNPSDTTARGSKKAISIFDNFSDAYECFYKGNKAVTEFTCEGFFKDFQFNPLKILDVKYE